jgi:hypothetical protein
MPQSDAAASGSIDVQLSEATPFAIGGDDSAPISSGRVRAVPAGDAATAPSKRLTAAAADALGEGVSKLGSGIETLGEGVTKLGDITKKVPLVGKGVTKIGEGVTSVGEVLHELPKMSRTRRGRLLIRSMFVAFTLVFMWIGVIVVVQLNRNDSPDFRPAAEQILATISSGQEGIDKAYDDSSPRFQEMVRKERFVDDMTDMNKTLGKFREITAVNEMLVTNGPTGKIGRVSITAAFEQGTCRAAVNFHLVDGTWKLFGIQVETPPELKITKEAKEERVAACWDEVKKEDLSNNRKRCDVRDAAETILEKLRDGKAGEVYDDASQVFKKQEERAAFIAIAAQQYEQLGKYKRIVAVTEAKSIGGTSATFDVLVEYDKTSAARNVFGFTRRSKTEPWKLRLYKVVLPMPRAADDVKPAVPKPPVPPVVPHDAGSK